MIYDVIVVGAGPAGSTTARECVERGLSVLILDKAEFPRDKPCGGGVTVRAAELLPFDLSPIVERTIKGLHLTFRQTEGFTRLSDKNITFLTQRSRLDTFLLEKATESGAKLMEGVNIRAVERFPTHLVVRSKDLCFKGRTLVAADGANGQTAKLSGINTRLTKQIALEGNITPTNGIPENWNSVMGLDIGGVPGGYGWIFPKGDHLNIGLGGWRYVGTSLRQRLHELVKFYGYDPTEMWGVKGHHLTVRQSNSPLAEGNVLLVGDAAGLIDPMTDEGIHSSIWSGIAASRHLTEYAEGSVSNLDGYAQQVERELVPSLNTSRRFQDIFHLAPRLVMRIEKRTQVFWKLTQTILRGEQTYDRVVRNHPKLATMVDFASDFVRTTPLLQRVSGLTEPAPPQRFFTGRFTGRNLNQSISQRPEQRSIYGN